MRGPATLLIAMLAACEGEPRPDVFVELVTDLQPGVEAAEVRVELVRGSDLDGPGTASQTTVLGAADDLRRARRVATFESLARGTYVVRVELFDAEERRVGRRRSVLTLTGTTVLRVVISRDCQSITCPTAGDPPDATECSGRSCVAPECRSGDPECTECYDVSDCDGATGCETAACTEGVCLYFPCATTVDAGPPVDGGGTDAGPAPADAGPSPADAGPPPLDAGASCATLPVGACDDGNRCTNDACMDDRCVHVELSDGESCTGDCLRSGVCFGGRCVGGEVTPGWCFVDGRCTRHGEPAVDDPCLVCDATRDQVDWTCTCAMGCGCVCGS